jgi:hypothetical protein
MNIKRDEILVLMTDLSYNCGTKCAYKGQIVKSTDDYITLNREYHIDVKKVSGNTIKIPVYKNKVRTIRRATLLEVQSFQSGCNNISQIPSDQYLNS